ncbi:MAG: mycothiol synthase [Kocuria sp.]|nr:mycothiol synthase [Kocuria sp.]
MNQRITPLEIGPLTLDAQTTHNVSTLGKACADHDGDPPFSDQTLVQLRSAPDTVTITGVRVRATQEIVGAAVVVHSPASEESRDDPPHAVLEAALAPQHRGHGAGRALITQAVRATEAHNTPLDAWAHGDHPAARAIAQHLGFTPVRELHRLLRPLTGVRQELVAALPEDLALRPFAIGRDESAWLEVNAAAFANHPEQGRMSLTDLQERQTEDWFDPQGFLIAHPVDDPDTIVGFHWTKVHPATDHDPARGEVHVVGVAPEHQGRGLGKALTVAGLHHLAARDLTEALLYVDADNSAAFALYRSLGFTPWHVDVMFHRD